MNIYKIFDAIQLNLSYTSPQKNNDRYKINMHHIFFAQLQNAHAQGLFSQFIKDSAITGELFEFIPALKGLDQVPQDPRWHPEGDVWTHTLLVIENLPSHATFAMALAGLFHDVGKASTTVIHETGRITAHGHESASKKIASVILDDLGADPTLKEAVLFLVFRHMLAHGRDTNEKTLRRLVNEGGYELVDHLLLHGVADVQSGCKDFTDCIRIRQIFDAMDKHPQPSP